MSTVPTMTITVTGYGDALDVDHALTAIIRDAHSVEETSGGGRYGELAWTWAESGGDVEDQAAEDVVTVPVDEHAGLLADRLTVDHLTALLGTTPTWDGGADYLDSVASILTVSNRPSVADGDQAWSYRERFQLATGRELPELHATEPECQGCFEQMPPGTLDDDGWCADHPATEEAGEADEEQPVTTDATETAATTATDLHMVFERRILREGR